MTSRAGDVEHLLAQRGIVVPGKAHRQMIGIGRAGLRVDDEAVTAHVLGIGKAALIQRHFQIHEPGVAQRCDQRTLRQRAALRRVVVGLPLRRISGTAPTLVEEHAGIHAFALRNRIHRNRHEQHETEHGKRADEQREHQQALQPESEPGKESSPGIRRPSPRTAIGLRIGRPSGHACAPRSKPIQVLPEPSPLRRTKSRPCAMPLSTEVHNNTGSACKHSNDPVFTGVAKSRNTASAWAPALGLEPTYTGRFRRPVQAATPRNRRGASARLISVLDHIDPTRYGASNAASLSRASATR